MSSKLKINKIFLLLILFIEIVSYLQEGENDPITLEENNLIKINVTKDNNQILNFLERNESFYITILSLTKDVKINMDNIQSTAGSEKDPIKDNNQLFTLKIKNQEINSENTQGHISFNVSENTEVEITSVRQNPNTEYKKIDYQLDQEIKVSKNNFVIFLDDEEIEKFEMKFSFKDDIKNQEVCYGFINLPTNKPEYIPTGKHFNNSLTCEKFHESSRQMTVNNKLKSDSLKPHAAFIFSINNDNKVINEFSFTINSEIINVFLIVSIVIALIFAVITFFLIRRKQSSESGTIEGEDNYNKKEEKEEKDDKEEATEN